MRNPTNLEGKVALITGAAKGIGAATAKALGEVGASVVLTDILDEVVETASALTKAGVQALHFKHDVADVEQTHAVVEQAVKKLGRIDILFNNAGIAGPVSELSEMPVNQWLRVIHVNLSGVYYCTQAVLPHMVSQGSGVIINSSSICGVRPIAGISPYVASKHGVIGITRSTALEYAGRGIRCVAIGPGYIQTDMTDGDTGVFSEEQKQAFLARIPQGRFGDPEDIAKAVRMLCSEDAVYVNGAYLEVEGGLLVT